MLSLMGNGEVPHVGGGVSDGDVVSFDQISSQERVSHGNVLGKNAKKIYQNIISFVFVQVFIEDR